MATREYQVLLSDVRKKFCCIKLLLDSFDRRIYSANIHMDRLCAVTKKTIDLAVAYEYVRQLGTPHNPENCAVAEARKLVDSALTKIKETLGPQGARRCQRLRPWFLVTEYWLFKAQKDSLKAHERLKQISNRLDEMKNLSWHTEGEALGRALVVLMETGKLERIMSQQV
ncbi:hypothetical protein B0T17DRAFT_602947 [Bombardia bombarda]|uniref:Uncharacterized protein n=1 Tax=Bombardia bombarda TaxID=252184 RepID=A0AA39WD14_9PEZI|nr:hypothetical protein B0T17DRAFT_602947 [Bombardia bombarda]